MKYPDSFINLIKYCLAEHPNTYIGTGNPDGKILFVGKQCAIDKDNEPEMYAQEITNNLSDWEKNLPSFYHSNGTQFNDVDLWVNPTNNPATYNPLYPYKGQIYGVAKKIGGVISNPSVTCSTWYYIQKLYDLIRGKSYGIIDLHEECFITELNQETSKYSSHQTKEETQNNIDIRRWIFKELFFNKFPITIFACGEKHLNEYTGGIIDIMDSRWVMHLVRTTSSGETYTVYKSRSNAQILILTQQFGQNVSNILLESIANDIRILY